MNGSTFSRKLLSPCTSRILAVSMALLVLALSLVPRPAALLGNISVYDKFGHFVAYAVLGFLAMRAVDRKGLIVYLLTVVGCTLFGGMIETMQPLVGRARELFDFLMDLCGAAAGAASAAVSLARFRGPR